jgi:ssDNA-binding Zn-finger/Zn-ribbon topoisomerase 1
VLSGRKGEKKALKQFDLTLEKQGVRLSTIPKDELPDASISRTAILQKPDPAVLLERRAAYLQRLKALRDKSLQEAGDPAIVGLDNRSHRYEIHELFPKKPDKLSRKQPPEEELPAETEEQPEDFLRDDLPLMSMSPPDESSSPADQALEEGNAPDLDESLPDQTITREILEEIDLEDTEAEANLEETLTLEEQIENKIRQFEQELAMPCPICEIGKVLSDTTEKGKTYYHCSNEECRLISWGKPYHMECPICKNPFLIETSDPDGKISLKCPRATCLYRKKSSAEEITRELNGTGKKKVAVRKRKGKRAVRRVVRRKS